MKYILYRKEDGRYLLEEKFSSVEEIRDWSVALMEYFDAKGWV